ncbi:MAG: DUF4142 domain-containing protein [Gemmatimonadaceae bacterium]
MAIQISPAARAVFAAAAVVMIGACAPKDDNVATTDTGMMADTGMAPSVITREWNDANVVGYLVSANKTDIEGGEAAVKKATDAEVKAFARRMVKEHGAALKQVEALATKLNITAPATGDDGIVEDHNEAMKDLAEKDKGESFDEAYIEHEIAMHKDLIDDLEDAREKTLNAELKAAIEATLPTLKAHLAAAEAIEKKFGM